MTTKITTAPMTVDQAKAHMTSLGERVLTVSPGPCGGFYVYSARAARGTMGHSAVTIEVNPGLGTFLTR